MLIYPGNTFCWTKPGTLLDTQNMVVSKSYLALASLEEPIFSKIAEQIVMKPNKWNNGKLWQVVGDRK